MSKKFIEGKYGHNSLDLASRQQKQLSYFLTSEIQEEQRVDYFEKFANSKYYTGDVFLDWVKGVLKHDNFLSFYKYFRNPNPSSKLINTRVKEPLSRVFFSEDSYFNYLVNGQDVEYPIELEDDFQEKLFETVLFRHNDIIVHDLFDTNEPYRKFVGIDKVVSIHINEHGKDFIEKIAYTAEVYINEEKVIGYAYLDADKYEFYTKDYELLISEPHDYEQCPATFAVQKNFDTDPIVKLSVFSHLRGDLEEYCFLKTLQRMTNANGVVPIVTKIKTKEMTDDGEDFDHSPGEPTSISQMGSQVSREARGTAGNGKGTLLQPGTIIEVPAIEKTDGGMDMELAKNFLNFFYAPTEALKYLNERIKELESTIITDSIGDYSEGNEASMTELQASKGFVSREDKLRWLSNTMSFSRMLSDKMMLALKYGKDSINVDIFYGSDFFMETQAKLYEMFKIAPNSIERKNILTRLAQRRNMFNKEKSKREVILYKLMPYASDKDFELAVDKDRVDDDIFEFQSRFMYWISKFEATYGNIATFWNDTEGSESEKTILLNNLIFNLIQTQDGKEASSETKSLQG
jgi:hypothetical protein